MKQFLIFVFQAFYFIIANLIDDGFANKMSIDVVVAYGSYIPITWTILSFYNIGKYAYTNTQKEPKTCMALGLIISILTSIFLLIFGSFIHNIFNLSATQIDIFNKLIFAYAFTLPLRQVGDFLSLYLMYQLKNKQVIIGDIIYWMVALSLDVYVFLSGMKAWGLVVTTGIAYVFYDIYLLWKTNILKEKINKEFIKIAFLKGKDIVIDRLCGKVATLAYGSMASQLPENLYAIHCVAYGVCTNCEEFTSNYNIFSIAKLKNETEKLRQKGLKLIKKYGVILIPIEYIFSFIFLIIYHGKVDFLTCIPWMLLYMTDSLSMLFYAEMKAVLSCYSKTEYLRYGGFIGIAIRIPFTFLMWKLGFGLIGFAIACTIDFLLRGIYFFIMAGKYEKTTR